MRPGAQRVASLACCGACDITRPDPELIESNGAAQMAMVGEALVLVRWFAEANRAISAYVDQAQQEFYEFNLGFLERPLRHLAALGKLVASTSPPASLSSPGLSRTNGGSRRCWETLFDPLLCCANCCTWTSAGCGDSFSSLFAEVERSLLRGTLVLA